VIPVEVDPLIAVLTTIPFLITVFGLHALIWKPMLALLAERETHVAGFLAEAETIEEDVATRTQVLDGRLSDARAEAVAERNRLRKASQTAEREIVDAARTVAEARMAEARAELDEQRAVAGAELRASAGALSVGIASAVLGRAVEGNQ
jgi:F-type H+-transporting ATPase subunit b